tara:strand:- start:66 stop:257 length:192 start_codon:yes stop_codon:yes gene_type:complete
LGKSQDPETEPGLPTPRGQAEETPKDDESGVFQVRNLDRLAETEKFILIDGGKSEENDTKEPR